MEKDDDDQEKVSGRNKLRATRKFILVLSVTNGSDWQTGSTNTTIMILVRSSSWRRKIPTTETSKSRPRRGES